MSQVQVWFERKFDFNFPVEQFPNLCARLRGTPARLEETLRGISRDVMIAKPGDKWSAQEHVGHLLDLESLWLARLNDLLRDVDTLATADLGNQKTNEAKHNARKLAEILAEFRAARVCLLDRAEKFKSLQPTLLGRTKLHLRLKQPMRVVDHFYFVAEHDDHHLARIWEMINMS